jgi:hypothetical protein
MPDVIAVLAGLSALVTALATLIATLRNSKKIRQVHVLVNGHLTDVLARVEQLTDALKGADVNVPRDPARPTDTGTQ